MSRIVERESVITPKFEPPAPPSYSAVAIGLSILAWIGLAVSSHYFHRQLEDPCKTFQLLEETAKRGFFRRQVAPPTCLDGRNDWFDETACLLPGVTYDANKYTYKECTGNTAAMWTLLPFKSTMLTAVVSTLFELYLILKLGQPFRVDYTAYSTSIKSFRDMLFAVVETAAIHATLVMTIGPENIVLDVALLYGIFFGVAALAPLLYFGRETSTPFQLAALEVIVATIVFFRGTVDGSDYSDYTLVLACLLRGAAMVVGRPTPSRSVTSTVLYGVSFLCLYLTIAFMGNYDPAFPLSFQGYTFPDEYENLVLVLCLVESVLGFGFTMMVSNKTYQACRGMASYFVWSLVYLGFLADPIFLFNPYKLSEVYRDHPPQRVRVKPYTEEHVQGMPKVLAIPSIGM